MKSNELKSGITKEWLRKMKDSDGNTIDRKIWVDEFGIWHETLDCGREITYPREKAKVIMHDGRNATQYPEEMRIYGFWLKLDGLFVAPMICLGYKNNTDTNQVIYTERNELESGDVEVYTETLILDKEKGAKVHVAYTILDSEKHLYTDKCWDTSVDIE